MTNTMGVGIIGCGNISTSYLKLSPMFKAIEIRACADINPQAANARAEEFGIRADSIDSMLQTDDIDIVINLTIPAAHYQVTKKILEAGKHVYSEKPFVLSLSEGQYLAKIAADKNLRIGSAPDTFLGGAHQHARHLIDLGAIGKVNSGTAHVMSHGMEHWHPNPDFFYKPGAGPILDIGPYYVTNLIQLIGPVKQVTAISSTPSAERTITSKERYREKVKVETPTTIHAILEFHSGAIITLGTSWDVFHHGHHNMELYGEEGTLYVPDPNFFGGTLRMTKGETPVENIEDFPHPFLIANQEHSNGMMANYRASGLADMAQAILSDRPHRCSLALCLHAVDVMTSILESGETGKFVEISTTCDRPAPLGITEARNLLA